MTAVRMLPGVEAGELLLGRIGGGFVVTRGWSIAWACGSGACAEEPVGVVWQTQAHGKVVVP